MPKYFSHERLQSAIKKLSETRAKAALLDFLIVKRTLSIKGKSQVAITQGEQSYIQATIELAGVHAPNQIQIRAEKQIFNVFASADTKGGFRNGRYISNGTGSTIGGNAWQTIVELSSEKPRQLNFRTGYTSHLENLLLKESPRLNKPSLLDVAIWTYRYVDLDPILLSESDPFVRGRVIVERFVSDLELTDEELSALFDVSGGLVADEDLTDTIARSETFLPGLLGPAMITEVPAAGLPCAVELVVALAAKPFVILTGASGTGKTRSTLRLAEQLQAYYGTNVSGQIFQLVAVGPDWTSPKKLLGYRSPFGSERTREDGSKTNESYEITDAIRIILRACHPSSTKVPHFLVFDEMNLSHVERYFAPFLSLIEASNILEDGENAPIIDRQSLSVISELLEIENSGSPEAESARLLVEHDRPLTLPPNLFYVGTVNVDETTYMFSPKVLDRAHVLEVRALAPSKYVTGQSTEASIDLHHANSLLREAIDHREAGDGRSMDPSEVLNVLVENHGIAQNELRRVKSFTLKVLDGCFHLLSPVGFEFAYRVVKEVYEYLLVWCKAKLAIGVQPQEICMHWVEGLDYALLQKVLPKIHGNRATLGDCLKALASFLQGGDSTSAPAAKYSLGLDLVIQIEKGDGLEIPEGKQFDKSVSKLLSMHDRLITRNYTSFVR
ncbi:McrB family protein [Ectothiorhodospira variabilis]|uniref:McrB family protein n=1 Tax=Ectothiorhodospira variabilis TaxID=505694 RepID=UPI001EFA8BD9|nr:hypothetical protein [Ectothiorhodospira variabilis]MCG5496011.1 hypothetical protein [Ectothiorhodospira variabilis]MCG5504172.1 hypothetical protein [Ectothiorhodospira variabilis]MCG5507327.1 hypothetical protein [Ectothiorhodospira variabilis]